MTLPFDVAELVDRYNPQLVLYPEIPEGKSRDECKNPDYPDESPLLYDYHPRDIKMVLEHSSFHLRFRFGKGVTRGWRDMLDRMERAGYGKNLDLLPGVQSDDRESFWRTYGDMQQRDEKYPRACYARVVRGARRNEDRVLVQYWYAYFYNDFWNTHEMDWETVMIVFKLTSDGPAPTVCACSAHFKGSWLPWSGVDKADNGTQPLIYVANGSHANYFYGPSKYLTIPEQVNAAARALNKASRGLADFTTSREEGSMPLVEARLIPDRPNGSWRADWRWLNQEGLWGSPGEWDLEFGDAGPKGPPQGGDRWDRPFRWINNTCVRAPSREEAQVPTLLEPEGV